MNAKKLFLQIKNRNHWMLHGFARNLNSEHCVSGWNNIKKSQILTKISNKTSFREFKGRQTIFFFSDFEKKKKILKVFLHDITYIFHFLHAKSYARLSYSMKMFTVEIDFSKFFCSTLKKKRHPGACHCKRIISAPNGAF